MFTKTRRAATMDAKGPAAEKGWIRNNYRIENEFGVASGIDRVSSHPKRIPHPEKGKPFTLC